MKKVVLILHNIRSCNNIGSLMRTAEGLGVDKIYLTGYTPYPIHNNDSRLPHVAKKIDSQINKTALGAQNSLHWEHSENIYEVIDKLKKESHQICAVEQSKSSINLQSFKPTSKTALILGREVEGIENDILVKCHKILEIPMFGKKESYNVSVAGAIALYYIKLLAS